jgi:hypothetical protein
MAAPYEATKVASCITDKTKGERSTERKEKSISRKTNNTEVSRQMGYFSVSGSRKGFLHPTTGFGAAAAASFASPSKIGRPRALSPQEAAEARETYFSQFVSVREIARYYGVSHSAVWRAIWNKNRS